MSFVLGGRYELKARIGSGGMAVVWRAFDHRLGREVAVKVLSETLAANSDYRRRFEREARHIASLSHPNIVVVHDFGSQDDEFYIVMELVRGKALRQMLAEDGVLSSEDVSSIGRDVLAALEHAHTVGIIHRDIKPGNILVGQSGEAKLADFGIAKATEETIDMTDSGKILGTVSYASPEQLSGAEIGPPSDLYSLGCVLYECLSGRPPFVADNIATLVSQQQFADPEPLLALTPDASPRLCHAVMRALEKNSADRFTNASEMRSALTEESEAALATGDPKSSPSLLPGERRGRRSGPGDPSPPTRVAVRRTTTGPHSFFRRGHVVAVGLVLIALVAGGLALALTNGGPSSPPVSARSMPVGYTPKFVSVSCPSAAGGGSGVTCGDLVVPEDRSRPGGPQVRLLVVRAPAETSTPTPDPALALGGLFGEVGTGTWGAVRSYSGFIGLSLRGTYGSTPELSCPEAESTDVATLALPPNSSQAVSEQIGALASCRAHLVASGIYPNDFGADAMAADVRDLLTVLHIPQVNLIAGDDTSPVAFDVMNRYPQLLRSVIIENPVPPGLDPNYYAVANLSAALQRYGALCDADPPCHAEFPDVPDQYLRVYDQFQQSPVTENVSPQPGQPAVPVLVDGQNVAVALQTSLGGVGVLPEIATQAYNPNPVLVATATAYDTATTPLQFWDMFLCKDDLPGASDYSQLEGQASAATLPQFAGVEDPSDLPVCRAWDVQPDNSPRAPIASDIPTLLFAGALNPYSSPTWVAQIAARLTHVVTVIFPTLTLGIVETGSTPPCLTKVEGEFLDQPTAHIDVSNCEADSPPISFSGT